jgi:hypothetical protein
MFKKPGFAEITGFLGRELRNRVLPKLPGFWEDGRNLKKNQQKFT